MCTGEFDLLCCSSSPLNVGLSTVTFRNGGVHSFLSAVSLRFSSDIFCYDIISFVRRYQDFEPGDGQNCRRGVDCDEPVDMRVWQVCGMCSARIACYMGRSRRNLWDWVQREGCGEFHTRGEILGII